MNRRFSGAFLPACFPIAPALAQESAYPPPSSLVTEHMPPIFLAIAEKAAPYTEGRRAEYGDERDPAMREFMEKTAPANTTQNVTNPLFMNVGFNDPRVPISESQQVKPGWRRRTPRSGF